MQLVLFLVILTDIGRLDNERVVTVLCPCPEDRLRLLVFLFCLVDFNWASSGLKTIVVFISDAVLLLSSDLLGIAHCLISLIW